MGFRRNHGARGQMVKHANLVVEVAKGATKEVELWDSREHMAWSGETGQTGVHPAVVKPLVWMLVQSLTQVFKVALD